MGSQLTAAIVSQLANHPRLITVLVISIIATAHLWVVAGGGGHIVGPAAL